MAAEEEEVAVELEGPYALEDLTQDNDGAGNGGHDATAADVDVESLLHPIGIPDKNFDEVMALTAEERQWAEAIKKAVEKADDIRPLPDLQYVQFALVHRNDLEGALERVRGLQYFREEYNISDTLEEGNEILHKFSQKHPGAFLTMAYNEEDETHVFIYDRSCIRFSSLRQPEDWRIALGAIFYVNHQMCPDARSMRNGCVFIAECEGTLRDRLSFDAMNTIWYHYLHNYPAYYKEIKFFHTNMVTNISFSMMKHLMSPGLRERFHLGCQFGANLGSLYRIPNERVATQRALRKMEAFLKKRYENQSRFKL